MSITTDEISATLTRYLTRYPDEAAHLHRCRMRWGAVPTWPRARSSTTGMSRAAQS
jgi:hypothetical protein